MEHITTEFGCIAKYVESRMNWVQRCGVDEVPMILGINHSVSSRLDKSLVSLVLL